MELSELFKEAGTGVLATSDSKGVVNTAIYSRPHIEDGNILVWGMTDGRSYANVSANPNASYLFRRDGGGYKGVRLGLRVLKIETSGPMLDKIKASTTALVGGSAGLAVTHTVWFEILELRPLI